MSAVLQPPLSGIAQQRFLAVGQQIRVEDGLVNAAVFEQVLDRETAWAESPAGQRELRGEVAAYRASVRALLDLVRVGWRLDVDRGTLELLPPIRLRSRLLPEQVRACKDEIRRQLWPMVAAQLDHPEFRRFVRRLETPSPKAKTKPITQLIASGKELSARLAAARSLPLADRDAALANVVQPYLQLVFEGGRDISTGLPLGDIWRYFRATWSIPNIPVPGRSLLYLIRDAGHPLHPVMGLIALNNAPMRKRAIDEWVGWTPGKLSQEALTSLRAPDAPRALDQLLNACLDTLRVGASNICLDAIATPEEIAQPTAETAMRLLRLSAHFDLLREKALKDVDRQNRQKIARRDRKRLAEFDTLDLPPLADSLPDLDKTPDPATRLARRLLIAKKRAYELSRLLQAQVTLSDHRVRLTNPSSVTEAWQCEEIVTALGTVCAAMRSARLSANLLEITTCGAVPPYNHLLGGKLAALLCFSPEIFADYKERYGGEPAIIRSHMANRLIPADSRLAAFLTTSLYAVGASQYERVRLPAGIIAPDQPDLRIRRIGESTGFGTVHFSPETVIDIEEFVRAQREYTDINSVFGEGPSPKLRKLRAGLDMLGFSADDLLRHHQIRLVYALEFWPGAAEFLRFGYGEVPAWISEPQRFRDATGRIADFWRRRWLAKRLDHTDMRTQLESENTNWRLSERLPVARPGARISSSSSESAATAMPVPAPSGRCIYERLAERRSDLYSERQSTEDLERLHVETPLDEFLLHEAAGHSLILTGNAGDGKTHLIRRLRSRLPGDLVVIEDATADMINGRPEPVLERIQHALNAGQRFLLCANEHQLLFLREVAIASGTGRLLDTFRAIDEQCGQRLVHGPVQHAETAQVNVVVLDLSLRNPLAPGFAGRMLDKLLADPEVRARTTDPRIERNYRRLSHAQVRQRLLELFDRLVLRGERATVRQLWMILARAVFVPDNACAGDAPRSWYSEQIFDKRGRLEIDRLLTRFADPAAHSHPRWDWHLREADEFIAGDWTVDGPPVGVNRTQEARHWFDSVKRRFYFEHRAGAEIFALESRAAREFRMLLRDGDFPDPAQVPPLLRGLNRLYCPPGFSEDDRALFLWQGLRYHEQPSRAYLAANSVSRDSFRLERPRPPARVARAFGSGIDALYIPDHLLLVAELATGRSRLLKLDYSLFFTLLKVADGLPRHLVPEPHIHRIDAFGERIGATESQRSNDFIVFNAEEGTVAKIRTSGNRRRIEEAFIIS